MKNNSISNEVGPQSRNLRTLCAEVLVLLTTALVFSFSFPGFLTDNGLCFFAFFSLIGMFAVIKNTTWKLIPLYGFLFGFIFYLCFNYWLKSFHPLAILIAPFIKGVELIFAFLALKAALVFFKRWAFLVEAVIWVAYAYLSQTWFAGYPYGTLGYAIYKYRVLIQIADITGVWGVTFMLVLPQIFLGNWLCDYYNKKQPNLWQTIKKEKIAVIGYGVLVLITVFYGIFSISYWNNKEPNQNWRVATVQHNADSWEGGYSTYKMNFTNLSRMSLEALRENPDIILWSETAFVPSVSWHTKYPNEEDPKTLQLVEDFVNFGKGLPVPLVTGNPEGVIDDPNLSAYDEDGNWNRKNYNTVIFFDEGQIQQTYRKQHLVPFTEHFPFEKELPLLYKLLKANDFHWWEKGYESVVFTTAEGVKFSTPICFEDVFGDVCAGFVKNGADVILNMTNDSWSGVVSAEMQHAAMATFRSIENRKTTIRSTNSGISCMISPTGKIIDPMTPFKAYWHIYDVPVFTENSDTIYTKWNDWFGRVMGIFAFLLLGLGLVNKFLKKRDK